MVERLQKIYRNYKKDSAERKTKQYFQLRVKQIETLALDFPQNHKKIVMLMCPTSHPYVVQKLEETFNDQYISVYCAIAEAQEKAFPPNHSTTTDNAPSLIVHENSINGNSAVTNIQLPKLPVPKFSGEFVNWPAFFDSFTQLIHENQSLNDIQKFHFLKQALPADSDEDIQKLTVTQGNYLLAWETIVKRYNNPRLQFMHHMNSLYQLPQQNKESSSELKQMISVANVCINELKRLNIAISACDHWIVHHLISKLPIITLQAWEHHLGSSVAIPTFRDFESFINHRLVGIDVLENRNLTSSSLPTVVTSHKLGKPQRTMFKGSSYHTTTEATVPIRCANCSDNHILRRCPKFLSIDCFARKTIVDRTKACLNCLSLSHSVSQCTSTRNCLQCGQRHHTLLHFPQPHTRQPVRVESIPSSGTHSSIKTNTMQLTNVVAQTYNTTLLATAQVRIHNCHTGQSAVVKALIDHGSEGTLITERLVQSLGLRCRNTSAQITGVGQTTRNRCKRTAELLLSSCVNTNFCMSIDSAFVLRNLTKRLPTQAVSLKDCQHLRNIPLADPSLHAPSSIDMLLGVDVIPHIVLPRLRKGIPRQPIAQETELGWIVFGQVTANPNQTINIQCHHTNLDQLVQKFFLHDEIDDTRHLTAEEQWCENHFKQTHQRQPNGKYLVRLPLKTLFDPSQTLGKSKQIASNRFQLLERKFQRQPEFHQQYEAVMSDYFELGHIKEIITTEEQHRTLTEKGGIAYSACTLPHHAVIKEKSSTTKLRIVYDASCKTSNGKSLNDILCTGPALQKDLAGVILNWRFHRFVFAADIQKMYRCIDMHPEDTQYQRVWWRDKQQVMKQYRLTTVTFGTASAPYTAIRVLHQLARDERERYPLAEKVLLHEIYVDDIQSGHATISEALKIRKQLTAALKSAGMQLRKWAAITQELLADLSPEHLSNTKVLEFDNDDAIKTLGSYWHPKQDYYGFKINFRIDQTYTKRSLLSTIARLYDPLGFLTPVITSAKMILKDVWNYRTTQHGDNLIPLEWDENLPSTLSEQWQTYVTNLSKIEHIQIPRWLGFDVNTISTLQLHVFCDGSSKAFAAAAYIRATTKTGRIFTHLIAARSRVTPNKPWTIPRVELSGAVLATKLTTWIQHQTHILEQTISISYWTDATTVLYWIKGDPSRWKTFIANRVGKILERSSPDQWQHISTIENPADCATRGLTPQQLSAHPLWWHGPPWLSQLEHRWPSAQISFNNLDRADLEEKPPILSVHHTHANEPHFISKFSSYNKLLAIIAYIQRFASNTKLEAENRAIGPLRVVELKAALTTVIRIVQQEAFSSEISLLKSNKTLPATNKLNQLFPFLDKQQVLRVRGRLQNATHLPISQRNPIILPDRHHLTNLIIWNAHYATLHGGTQLTLATIRLTFWIINGRQAVKRILKTCIPCFKHRQQPSKQLMADLPLHRVNPPRRPLIATGVDCTGSFEVKASRFRGQTSYKAYIAVFICLATKAIHLEAVTGLTTEHFLWALQRFIGRRGYCEHMYSDCGTNFVGADQALQNWWKTFQHEVSQRVVPTLAANRIQWHFNPPYSPNFGGLWEANVKSVKMHLHRTFRGVRMTYEQLSTVLTQIEACLNSRPLCPLNSDPDDLTVLTPAHFLIGDSLLAAPEHTSKDMPLSEQFLSGQRLLRQFWNQWSHDWLAHLQSRPKWRHEMENLQINDIVIIKDDRLPPNEWRLGRITEVHPGKDNLVRVVTVHTSTGIYKRSISKICRLPLPR